MVARRRRQKNRVERAACACPDLPRSLGMARLLARLADEALGSDEFEEALNGSRKVAERFEPLVEALRRYEEVLAGASLVDGGRACRLMAGRVVGTKGADEAIVYDAVLTAAQRKLADARFARVESRSSFGGRIVKPKEGVELRFAFPSGRYAEPFLLVDAIARYADKGSVLVTARDPFALYESLADALARESNAPSVRVGLSAIPISVARISRRMLSCMGLRPTKNPALISCSIRSRV